MDAKILNGRFKISAAEHTCSLCRNSILPSERYKIITSVANGRIYSFQLCDICCKEIGYIKKYSGIDISKQLNYCLDDNDREIIKSNRKILNDHVTKYCVPQLGRNLTEVKYNIQQKLTKER